ncbi:hypothetical protein A2160_04125 [Candidatus Beckwithbacteria bacterium RBG_13_42_9]|uniref:Homing endonuclease LAGLIDADG domain-containing protein n=1 Tax=Candidatus Beckwithbacteria bacterium RBG_13_42_9 TaxID=1797457 RepID=A0A1F5E6E5_9BACT|nr:MAG: hypothetical protein A2160_04125 [Candidatus Beckwithbacteria bacterium RBG_13_42_9]
MLKISDDYLVGFIEGEGAFYIGIVPSKETKSGWQVIYFFKVSQNPSGRAVLDFLKRRLSCGYVKENYRNNQAKDKSLAYVVRDIKSLREKVIPFLKDKLVIKRENFEKFREVIKIVSENEHLGKEGVNKIADIAYSMNTGKRKVTKSYILSTFK